MRKGKLYFRVAVCLGVASLALVGAMFLTSCGPALQKSLVYENGQCYQQLWSWTDDNHNSKIFYGKEPVDPFHCQALRHRQMKATDEDRYRDDRKESGCASDVECKGDRICVHGECVNP